MRGQQEGFESGRRPTRGVLGATALPGPDSNRAAVAVAELTGQLRGPPEDLNELNIAEGHSIKHLSNLRTYTRARLKCFVVLLRCLMPRGSAAPPVNAKEGALFGQHFPPINVHIDPWRELIAA